jgi:hypothetical protein
MILSTEREGGWVNTGQYQKVEQFDRVPDYDPRKGDHLWTINTMYRWGGPDVEQPTLDMENLLVIAGPGCFYCEKLYSPLLARRRCPGPK